VTFVKLEAERIEEIANQDAGAWQVQIVEEIGSTNDQVREWGLQGAAAGIVLFAENQVKGRGRREKSWVAAAGRDLLFSVLLRPHIELSRWSRLTTLAALAVCKAIGDELPLEPEIKWPNDVYVRGKKVCGLLAEVGSSSEGAFIVIGVGVNVNTRDFPEEIAATATSLCLEVDGGKREMDRTSLAGGLLHRLHQEFSRSSDDLFVGAMEEVRERSFLMGKTVRAFVDGAECFGRVMDLNPDGHLVLIMPDGSRRELSSAENVRALA
jgi:BirA family biotin operon repressor/biotin-[acetyl-CoA-carboxylase] ligase